GARRPGGLWAAFHATSSATGAHGREGAPRRQACRSARRAADHFRAGRQSQGCEGDRPRNSGDARPARRQGERMTRRQLITLLGGAAATGACWPLLARAEKSEKTVRVGMLLTANPRSTPFIQAFAQRLRDLGHNLAIEY